MIEAIMFGVGFAVGALFGAIAVIFFFVALLFRGHILSGEPE